MVHQIGCSCVNELVTNPDRRLAAGAKGLLRKDCSQEPRVKNPGHGSSGPTRHRSASGNATSAVPSRRPEWGRGSASTIVPGSGSEHNAVPRRSGPRQRSKNIGAGSREGALRAVRNRPRCDGHKFAQLHGGSLDQIKRTASENKSQYELQSQIEWQWQPKQAPTEEENCGELPNIKRVTYLSDPFYDRLIEQGIDNGKRFAEHNPTQ